MTAINILADELKNTIINIDLEGSITNIADDLDVSKNILAYLMGNVLLWNENTFSLYLLNINKATRTGNTKCYQELIWNNIPNFDVNNICVSPTESQVALFGPDGAQILTIPSIQGTDELFKGRVKTVSCATIDEKYFGIQKHKIVTCRWLPGLACPNVFVILTSDSFLRVYRTDIPHEAIEIINLNVKTGESIVSFDISDPSVATSSNSGHESIAYWTVYLLLDNGQVCTCVLTYNPSQKGSFQHEFQGPLNVYPPAEDNCGSDACSILFVNSIPPAIVIATREGVLQHCVVLNSDDAADDALNTGQQSLHVFETVQLELELKADLVNKDLGEVDSVSCPLQLYRDPVDRQRYHCYHPLGLHTVSLSWIAKFEEFFEEESSTNNLEVDEHCVVEHILCTKPFSSSSVIPMIGFAQLVDESVGVLSLCLTSDLQVYIFPLQQCREYLISNDISPELKQLTTKDVILGKIAKCLQKQSTNPFITGLTTSSSEDKFNLLCRFTQVFREEYILKYEKVQGELGSETSRLRKMKIIQEENIKQIKTDCNKVKDNHQSILKKLELIVEKQSYLKDMLKYIGRDVEKSMPILSEAEIKLKRNFENVQSVVDSQEQLINKLSKRTERYEKERRKSNPSESINIPDEKADCIRKWLSIEGEELKDLMKNMKIVRDGLEF